MTGLSALIVPILLSAVLVFVASSIIHMLLPWHHSDYPKLTNEDGVRDALRPLAIPPGDYMVPRPSSTEDMRSPEFAEKMKQGPVLIFTVIPNGPFSMRRNLILWFLYCVVVGLFAAYIAGRIIASRRALPARISTGRRRSFRADMCSRSGRCRSGITVRGPRPSRARSTG